MKIIYDIDLIKRGISKGDMFKIEFDCKQEFNGWYLAIGEEGESVGLNTSLVGAHTHIVGYLLEDLVEIVSCIMFSDSDFDLVELGKFFRDFDESFIDEHICKVKKAVYCQYIKGVHFGNPKEYVWRVSEEDRDILDIEVGNIVAVETNKGIQIVEVREVYEQIENKKHKKVIDVLEEIEILEECEDKEEINKSCDCYTSHWL